MRLGWLLLFCLSPAWAHKFHASLADMSYNPDSGNLEIVVRVFSLDLARGLSQSLGREIILDREKEIEELTFAYFAKRFTVGAQKDQPAQLIWVGMDTKVDTTWLYLEAPLAPGSAHLMANSRLFFELEPTQVNTVNLKMMGRKASVIFKRGDRAKTLF